jgi:hypothetical protein
MGALLGVAISSMNVPFSGIMMLDSFFEKFLDERESASGDSVEAFSSVDVAFRILGFGAK